MVRIKNKDRNALDMDGAVLRRGDRVVCLTLPKREPCLSRVLGVGEDGSLLVSNGRIRRSVDPESCILQTAD